MTDLNTRVATTINDFINKSESFTILDISNTVNAQANPFANEAQAKHYEVRTIAKPILDVLVVGRGYEATSIGVVLIDGTQATAMLYHSENVDPNTYVKKAQSVLKTAVVPSSNKSATPVQKKAAAVPAHATNARATLRVKVRADGALEVPALLLVEAQLVQNDVDVVNHPNSVSVVLGNDRVATAGFRVSAKTLAESNLRGLPEVWVSAFSDKIVISK